MTKSNYPLQPAFPSPNAHARASMLGTFEYRAMKDGSIKFLDDWAEKNLVKVFIPQLAHVEAAPKNCTVVFHRAGAKQLQSLFAAWERAGLIHLVKTWAGTFAPRMVRGSTTNLSNHAYASAFDINAAWNGLGKQPATDIGTVLPLVALANAHGFFWGGHYSNRLDGMHFELAVLNMFPKTLIATAAPGGAVINHKTEVTAQNVGSKINSISAAPIAAEKKDADPIGTLQQTAGNPPQNAPMPAQNAADNSQAPPTQKADVIVNNGSGGNDATGGGDVVPPDFTPEVFTQYIPQITKAKRWLGGGFVVSLCSTVAGKFAGLPDWLIFILGVITGMALAGLIWLFVSYHKQVFALVKDAMQLRADPTKNNPVLIAAK